MFQLKELRKEQERKEKEEKKREKEEKKNEKEQAKNPNLNTTSPVSSPSTESKREIDVNNNTKTTPARPYQLIVVDGDETHGKNSKQEPLFKCKTGVHSLQASNSKTEVPSVSFKLHGLKSISLFILTQVTYIKLTHSHSVGCLLTIAPFRESENQIKRPNTLTIKPDFFIIRNQVLSHILEQTTHF